MSYMRDADDNRLDDIHVKELLDELPDTYLPVDGGGKIVGPNAFPGPVNVTNDPTWDITDLPEPLGHFTTGLGSKFVNPDPPDAASGGMVNAAIVTQIEGTAGANPTNRLFLDALLVRLGLQSYNDAALTTFAGATGIELDIAIDGASNNIQSIKGLYVVPIAGQLLGSGHPVSGTIDSLEMIRSDSLQTGYVAGSFLHFDQAIGIHAGRPIGDPLNVTYDVQYSLLADRGQLFYTRYAEHIAWFGISDDTDNTKVIWQRINPSGSLEWCKTDGTVLASLSNTGVLTVNVPTQSPGDNSTKPSSTAFVTAAITAAIDTDGTLAGNSDAKVPSQKAVKTYADQLIASADAMVFKGVIDCSANPNYPAANRGDTYRVSVAGRIGGASGPKVEIGDLLLCLTDGTVSGNHATVGANWSIAQTNIDGAVVGPTSATDANIALFDGATGKLIKDSATALSALVPTSRTVNGHPLNADVTVSKSDVGLGSVVDVQQQPLDATLTALATLATGANKLPYSTGTDTFAQADLTAFARTLLDDADATAARTTLGAEASGAAAALLTTTITNGDTAHAPNGDAVYDALALKTDKTPMPASGNYFYATSPAGAATSNTLGNGTLRATPFVVHTATSIDRIAADVATIGEAGSKVRLGIYADDGTGVPGNLVVDAGQIAGDSATVQELTISQTLQPGLYWAAAAVQSAPTTQPTVRIASALSTPVHFRAGTSLPSAGGTQGGYSKSGVTGALPSPFGTPSAAGSVPRLILRTA